jgi:hypothetical protein
MKTETRINLEIYIDLINDEDMPQDMIDDMSLLLKKYGYEQFSCESKSVDYGTIERVRYIPKELF